MEERLENSQRLYGHCGVGAAEYIAAGDKSIGSRLGTLRTRGGIYASIDFDKRFAAAVVEEFFQPADFFD